MIATATVPAATSVSPMRSFTPAAATLSYATAVVVTTEFIIVGVLPPMAHDLQISIAQAGLFVTWFALSAALVGPIVAIAASKTAPRTVLAVVLSTFAVGNALIALVPSYAVITAVRVVQGMALPVFVSVGNTALAHLAGPGRRGEAIALVNIGTVIVSVGSLPAGVAVASRFGWETTFLGLAIFAALALAAVIVGFRNVSAIPAASLATQATILRERVVLGHLLLSAVLFASMFTAYTYLAAFLERVSLLRREDVALALMAFGGAGLVGNWLAGRYVERRPIATTAIVAGTLTLVTLALSLTGRHVVWLLPLLALWGATHAAAFVACQVRVMLAGSRAPVFALALNISACNIGIAVGAAAGAWVIQRYGLAMVGLGAATLAVVAFFTALLVARDQHPPMRSME